MAYGETTSAELEQVAADVVDCAFRVHRNLGPGLLESVYVTCLAYELRKRGRVVARQVKVPILYDGQYLDGDLFIDLLVEKCLIVEVKAVEKMHPVFEAQAITYLKLTGHRLCLLINFNVPLIKTGIKRIIR